MGCGGVSVHSERRRAARRVGEGIGALDRGAHEAPDLPLVTFRAECPIGPLGLSSIYKPWSISASVAIVLKPLTRIAVKRIFIDRTQSPPEATENLCRHRSLRHPTFL